jgi:putative hydrolase of the HAD superfamily
VITDWGGVMTSPIAETVRAWLAADNIDYARYAEVMRPWASVASDQLADGNPVHALERGECPVAEFERILAARLVSRDGTVIAAEGLLDRMFAATRPCQQMYAAIRAVRKAGLRTGLLSNSWGLADYPRHEFPAMFDAVVISGEVGMRKPEERIFTYVARRVGARPSQCVFIDDLAVNVRAAEAVGMTGILHRDPAGSLANLAGLLGVPLR